MSLGARAAVLVVLLWAVGFSTAQDRALDPEVFDIGAGLRCPTCVSESVAESNSAIAREMRLLIQDQLDAGSSRAEVLAFFQARYGDWILLDPPRRGVMLIVWLLPVAGLVAGGVVVAILARRWQAAAAATPDVDPADRQRVRAALEARFGAPPAATDHAGSDPEDDPSGPTDGPTLAPSPRA